MLLKDREQLCEEYLGKLFKKSLEGLHMALNEIHRCQGYSWYYTSAHDISNLKSNLLYLQEHYDGQLRKLSDEIKSCNTHRRDTHELWNEIDHLFEKTTEQLSLASIFSAVGVDGALETMNALFTGTGTGVLGIAPLRTPFVINNSASELMFKDKLNELEAKLIYVIRSIELKKSQQVDHLNLYFNLLRKQSAH